MTYKVTRENLDRFEDPQYVDILKAEAMRSGEVWQIFLEPERVDRTLEVVRDLKASLEQQLGQARLFQNGGDPQWRVRTVRLLRRVDIYLSDVKAEIKRLDREEFQESAAGERDRWRNIAGTLVDLLSGNPALDLITLPIDDITAAEWADIRGAKRGGTAA